MSQADNLRDLSPAEVDQILADTEYEAMKAAAPLVNLKTAIRDAYRFTKKAYGKHALARAEQRLADLEAKLPETEAKVAEALKPFRSTIDAINDEFNRRGGWTRYWLVCNTGGHVHKSRNCSSCYVTTEFAWLPGASGQDGAGLIAMFGSKVCTVCFPEAPISDLKAAEKEAAKAKAAADGYCSGHGKYAKDNGLFNRYSPRGECPDCGQTVSVTKLTKVRKHKVAA